MLMKKSFERQLEHDNQIIHRNQEVCQFDRILRNGSILINKSMVVRNQGNINELITLLLTLCWTHTCVSSYI